MCQSNNNGGHPVLKQPDRPKAKHPQQLVEHARPAEHQLPGVRPDQVDRKKRQKDKVDNDLEPPVVEPGHDIRQRERQHQTQRGRHRRDGERQQHRLLKRGRLKHNWTDPVLCRTADKQVSVLFERRLPDNLERHPVDGGEADRYHERQRSD